MHLLVAVDGSDEAERALDYAATICRALDGSMTVVHAVDPGVLEFGGNEPISTLSDVDDRLLLEGLEDAEERGLDVLEDAEKAAEELGIEVATELLYGDPVQAIGEYADETGADGIYVGHRGRTERAERLVGSVAKDLVERATVPVTVVR